MNTIEYNNLLIDLDRKEVYIDDQPVNLTKTEYNLLLFFIENKNKVFSRKDLMQNVWESEVSLRAVDTTVSRLRKKLGSVGRHITTRLGFGYGFMS